MISKDEVLRLLSGIKYPGYSRNIVSFGIVQDVGAVGNDISVKLVFHRPIIHWMCHPRRDEILREIAEEVDRKINAISGVGKVDVEVQDVQYRPARA